MFLEMRQLDDIQQRFTQYNVLMHTKVAVTLEY